MAAGQIYLYGEAHGVERIMDRQLELWREHYFRRHIRHLFLEYPYYTMQFLNIWMASDNDDILYQVYNDLIGTACAVSYWPVFFKTIKEEMPQTIFHGTDVGHQYDTIGQRFLQYLKASGLQDTPQYALTLESIAQGKTFYENPDFDAYRETKMTENFVREFEMLAGQSVMGIYGTMHIAFGEIEEEGTPAVPTMAKGLQARYGDAVQVADLSYLALRTEPIHMEKITVGGKLYDAAYFGEEDIPWSENYVRRKFWRLENVGEDFAKCGTVASMNVLPYDNYPTPVETGQVFVIDYTAPGGSVDRQYFRADGDIWQGQRITCQIEI